MNFTKYLNLNETLASVKRDNTQKECRSTNTKLEVFLDQLVLHYNHKVVLYANVYIF